MQDLPSGPWDKVGIDLFQHKSHDYLLVADYISNFLLFGKLNNQTAAHVMSLLKTIFLEDGIPAYMFTDKERHFTSAVVQGFTKCYQLEILHSTPRYPQSNQFIDPMVKIVKQTIKKADSQGKIHIMQC